MTAQNKTTIKGYFETGDRPTQGQFADMIDSYIDTLSPVGNANALGVAGAKGIVNITSTLSAALVSAGTVGLQILTTNTTAQAFSVLGAGAVGSALFTAATTAAAQNTLGGTTVGKALFQATTTAAATNTLGAGAVGTQIFQAATTAAVQNIVGGLTVGSLVSGSTSVMNFTGIPSNINFLTIAVNNLSSSGTSNWGLLIGTSAGNEVAGYSGEAARVGATDAAFSTSFVINVAVQSADNHNGEIRGRRITGNTWVFTSEIYRNSGTPFCGGSGNKTITANLDRFQIFTIGSADVFDDGSAIWYAQ